jgi:hypothetical protein
MVQSEVVNLPAQGVAVNSQRVSGLAPVPVAFFKYLANKTLLKFAHGILVGNPLLDELVDQGFELLFHNYTPRERFIVPAESIPYCLFIALNQGLVELLESHMKLIFDIVRHCQHDHSRSIGNIWRQDRLLDGA